VQDDKNKGGECVFKNKWALCGRKKVKDKNIVSGPKYCTPE